MSKFSLYFIMSVLLPGSFPVFVFLLLFKDVTLPVNDSELLTLCLYLIAAVFLGVLIHTIGDVLLKFYRAIGIHYPIYSIYSKLKLPGIIQIFFEDTCKKHFDKDKTEKGCMKNNCSKLYDWMYYTLEAEEKIEAAKSFQSFYYFFRNFFTMAVLLIIPVMIINIRMSWPKNESIIFFALLFILISSYWFARLYRKKMVEKMFWTFFALRNKL